MRRREIKLAGFFFLAGVAVLMTIVWATPHLILPTQLTVKSSACQKDRNLYATRQGDDKFTESIKGRNLGMVIDELGVNVHDVELSDEPPGIFDDVIIRNSQWEGRELRITLDDRHPSPEEVRAKGYKIQDARGRIITSAYFKND